MPTTLLERLKAGIKTMEDAPTYKGDEMKQAKWLYKAIIHEYFCPIIDSLES